MQAEQQAEQTDRLHPFQRLQVELADLISVTPAGERLPAEPELSRRMGVSRATLREAMRSFEGQGLIRRRQGVGTFVVGRSPVMDTGLEVLESIETLAHKIGLAVSMGDLQINQIRSDAALSATFSVEEGSPLVEVRRVIHTAGRPIAYLVDVLPGDVLSPQELASGFTGSVLDFLLRRGSPELCQSIAEIRAVAAVGEQARALQIQRGDVLLQFVARLFARDNTMVDYSLSYFLPGFFSFKILRKVGEAC